MSTVRVPCPHCNQIHEVVPKAPGQLQLFICPVKQEMYQAKFCGESGDTVISEKHRSNELTQAVATLVAGMLIAGAILLGSILICLFV